MRRTLTVVFERVKDAGDFVIPVRWLQLSLAILFLIATISAPTSVLMASGTSTPDPPKRCRTSACKNCNQKKICDGEQPVTTDCPIYLGEGGIIEEVTDLSIPGPDLGWSFTRTYSSNGTGYSALEPVF